MSYIFVGGSQRSGTTLLAQSLCSGEETNPYFGESGSLRILMQLHRHMTVRFDEETVFSFGTRERKEAYVATCVNSFLQETLAAQSPATSLVLKEPHLTMFFPSLWLLVPSAKFVIVVRDPRDIVASMLRVGEKLQEQGEQHLFNSGDIVKIAESIPPFYLPSLRFGKENPAFRKAVRYVKYETFLAEPNAIMDDLRKFTGLSTEKFDPAAGPARVHATATQKASNNDRLAPWITEAMNGQPLDTTNIGKHTEMLTKSQIRAVEEAIPDLMKKFSYKVP